MSAKPKKQAKKGRLSAAEMATLRKLLAKADGSELLTRIETPRVKETKNFRKVKRAFWTDGTHAYLRRKKANPAIRERTDEKVKRGEYKHIKTSDDVEIYEIAETSPLRRKKVEMGQLSEAALIRCIVRYACKEEWRLYYDAVSELAYRYKNSGFPAATAELQLQTTMAYLEHRIMRRGGPSPMLIAHQLRAIRKERTGTQIFLPH